MKRIASLTALAALGLVVSLSACSNNGITSDASYPTRPKGSDKILYSDQKQETVWGGDDTLGNKLFGSKDKDDAGGAGIGVNSFLWRASLNTIAFMPVASADPFGGVILTDWYENPDTPNERFKLSIYILDRQLRADGVRVSVFKQVQDHGQWHDTKVPPDMAGNLENTILTRARELRVTQLGNAG